MVLPLRNRLSLAVCQQAAPKPAVVAVLLVLQLPQQLLQQLRHRIQHRLDLLLLLGQ